MFGVDFLVALLPALVPSAIGVVGPKVTEYVKKGADALAGGVVKLPSIVKVVINAVVSAALAGLSGSVLGFPLDTSVAIGAGTGLASSAGFAAGKKS